jgi:glucose/arabinose dehydrogenase
MCKHHLRIVVAVCLAAASIATLAPVADAAPSPRHVRIGFDRKMSGLSAPVAIAAPNDGSNRIFVVEQPGRIRVRTTSGSVGTYLDIRSKVAYGGERGMLGLAFSPGFATNGYFFVDYVDNNGDVQISRFHATPSSNRASAAETHILKIEHSAHANHNGGQVEFGLDGMLYVGVGDGGGQRDPNGNGQDLGILLGKILRIDVSRSCGSRHYCIPSSNPFAGSSSRRKEIWHYGLRNPWKFSFDDARNWMWIADVGEKAWEEVDTSGASTGGRNYGWDCREGTSSTGFAGSYCGGRRFVGPAWEYSHGGGRCAIIGGYAYRGARYRSVMSGIYFYGDFCTGQVWGFVRTPNGSRINSEVHDHSRPITTFGQAQNGELFVADTGGNVYHLVGARR